MADGMNAHVTLAPQSGLRVRGSAVGLGDSPSIDLQRPELFDARRTGDVGLVHSWELVTAVDGPGTRLTIFMSGCPLRCQYCHNPDTMEMREGILERVEDIITKVMRYTRIFRVTGGGLTISGGEPLFQIAFTRRVLEAAHRAGIHTAIDTSGYLGARLTERDLDNIDVVLLDLKSGNPDIYRNVTGRDLQPTIEFGDRLTALSKKIWLRYVLVPGLTDSADNITAAAAIARKWSHSIERVEVLPFHNMGEDKWHHLGLQYSLSGVRPPSNESLEQTRQIFRNQGLHVY